MNFRELQYFVAIAEQGHFGRASRAVNVSQPTLSMQFKKLEDRLGTQLIERLATGAKLTPLGEELLPIARQILTLSDDIERRCGTCSRQNRIKLGVIPTIAPYLLPKINRELRRSFSGRKILLSELQTDALVKHLKDGLLDAAILSTPIEESALQEIDVYSEKFFLAVNKSHPLARRKEVSLRDIRSEKLLLLDEGHCMRKQALAICNVPHNSNDTDLSATSIETLRNMVALGAGVTLIPELAVRKGDGIRYIPFSDTAPSRTVGIAFRRSYYDRGLIDALHQVLQSTCVRTRVGKGRKQTAPRSQRALSNSSREATR
ncbi:MAG: LysR family transcriptional regulator [Bdellovibrionales bacterium]|nr:LysR family transcriptional regulator [Bdellovibrionales bacterium]